MTKVRRPLPRRTVGLAHHAVKKVPGLTQDQWATLRMEVVGRDLLQAYKHQPTQTPWATFARVGTPCVARFLDPSESGPCLGRITLDHVKCHPMIGAKAPDNKRHLVSLCVGHHTETRAGRNWATANREKERDYLEEIYGTCTECE